MIRPTSARRCFPTVLLGVLTVLSAAASADPLPREDSPSEAPVTVPLPDDRAPSGAHVSGVFVRKTGTTPLHADARIRFEAASMICPKFRGRAARLTRGRLEDAGTFYGYEYIGPTYVEYLYLHELVPLDANACDFQVRLKKIVTAIRRVGDQWEITTYAKSDNRPGDVNDRHENALLDLMSPGYLPARRKFHPGWRDFLQDTGSEAEPFPFVHCRVMGWPGEMASACITDSPRLPAFARPMSLRVSSPSPDSPAHAFEGRVETLVSVARIDRAVFDPPRDLPVKDKRYVSRP
ncbi:hypothetical protein [Thiobacter aerophilum]|uniref:Secreted protein n=1 Tax=Thiobacter aerophilum TaxID=3121275 RepID=A0ABV0EK55_9BURK